jgi:hypothetical protein
MASHIRRLIWNTRERLLSTDLNDAQALQHRAMTEALAASQHGDQQQLGVLRGLTVSIPGGSLSVNVAAGIALRLATAATPYDSPLQWIELATSTAVDLASFVDPANPRWVCIEIAGADTPIVQSLRDIFLPANCTFTQATVDKVRGSAPTLHVTAGTAAATPQFPAGTAGRIPLAYVYLPAAAGTLTAGDIVHCRPILKGGGHFDTFRGGVRDVQGGGVEVTAAGTSVVLEECTGTFPLHHVPFGIAGGTTLAIPTAGWDGAATPGASAPTYLYAVPAPFPAGFDSTLAPREFRPEASAATRFPALVSAGFSGCIVIASAQAPNTATVSGAPSGGGNFSITAAPWGALSIVVPHSRAVYLGAISWRFASTNFAVQRRRGGWVAHDSLSVIPAVVIHDGTIFNFTAGDPVNIWDDAYPVTASEVLCHLTVAGGTATAARIAFDDFCPNVTGTGSHAAAWSGDVPTAASYEFIALPSDIGEITYTNGFVTAAVTDLGSATLMSMAYRDVVLERR